MGRAEAESQSFDLRKLGFETTEGAHEWGRTWYYPSTVAWKEKRQRVRLRLAWEEIISGGTGGGREWGGVWWSLPDPGKEQILESFLDAHTLQGTKPTPGALRHPSLE